MELDMRGILTAAIAAALGAAISPAEAVLLNPRGTGQVLIYSYYTVNHQQTLVSVINTTARGKALKVRFREAYDGRDVANFNVYLGPYDSWVGAVFDASSNGTGAAAIGAASQVGHFCGAYRSQDYGSAYQLLSAAAQGRNETPPPPPSAPRLEARRPGAHAQAAPAPASAPARIGHHS